MMSIAHTICGHKEKCSTLLSESRCQVCLWVKQFVTLLKRILLTCMCQIWNIQSVDCLIPNGLQEQIWYETCWFMLHNFSIPCKCAFQYPVTANFWRGVTPQESHIALRTSQMVHWKCKEELVHPPTSKTISEYCLCDCKTLELLYQHDNFNAAIRAGIAGVQYESSMNDLLLDLMLMPWLPRAYLLLSEAFSRVRISEELLGLAVLCQQVWTILDCLSPGYPPDHATFHLAHCLILMSLLPAHTNVKSGWVSDREWSRWIW